MYEIDNSEVNQKKTEATGNSSEFPKTKWG
jgi:hypothetical protein